MPTDSASSRLPFVMQLSNLNFGFFRRAGEFAIEKEYRVGSRKMAINQLSLSPPSVTRVLGTLACVLVLASIAGQLTAYLTGHTRVYGLVRLFYLDAENNIPTGFSVLLLLFASLLLGVITLLKRREAGPVVWHWAILSSGFLFMAADEAWSIHERLIRPVRTLLGADNLGIFYYAWVVPGMALVLVLALLFARFLWRLPARTRLLFLVAVTLYLGGAIGVELIGGRFAELHGQWNLTYSMIATVEESLEMAGIILFIRALLEYISEHYQELRIWF